jgi:hypothetical protein
VPVATGYCVIKLRASTTKNHLDAVIWLHGDLIDVLSAIRPKNALLDDPVLCKNSFRLKPPFPPHNSD